MDTKFDGTYYPHSDENEFLSGISNSTGIGTDQLKFVISQVAALCLASLLRKTFHPSKAKPRTRHWFEVIVGLWIVLFCFGRQAIHLVTLPTMCYVIIQNADPEIMQRIVLAVSLLYLSTLHLYRQLYNYGSTNLDITGPIMVITQKVTSLAFNLHDGLTKKESDLTKTQKMYVVHHRPGLLEYLGYCLSFQTIVGGPAITFKEYIEFIEGNRLRKMSSDGRERDGSVSVGNEPSPMRAVFWKMVFVLVCAATYVAFLPLFSIQKLKEDHFVEDTGIMYKFWYIYISTSVSRLKYYFVWVLADAISNNSGMGFNGYNEDGVSRWNKNSNVDILKFETGTNLRETLEAWNLRTNLWLRMVVYERAAISPILMTYGLSALWHGFYPGYYMTFASGALFTIAARIGRRHIRHYFVKTSELKAFYDVLTCIVTRVILTYFIFTFVLLDFSPSIRLYTSMYWCFHLIAVAMVVLVPVVLPKPTPNHLNVNQLESTLRQVGPITNSIL